MHTMYMYSKHVASQLRLMKYRIIFSFIAFRQTNSLI